MLKIWKAAAVEISGRNSPLGKTFKILYVGKEFIRTQAPSHVNIGAGISTLCPKEHVSLYYGNFELLVAGSSRLKSALIK